MSFLLMMPAFLSLYNDAAEHEDEYRFDDELIHRFARLWV